MAFSESLHNFGEECCKAKYSLGIFFNCQGLQSLEPLFAMGNMSEAQKDMYRREFFFLKKLKAFAMTH